MGKVTDILYDTYITKETNCSATMFKSAMASRGREVTDEDLRLFSGFSGGVSTENLCGALIGGVAAISCLINKGDEETFEKSKEATEKFYNKLEERFGSTRCHDIKTEYRTEELRCYNAVEIMAQILEDVLTEYGV
ncbi:MAG: C_GCAxxG_C_C family protein [Lachnospiraceae bacterium]|nr:C_GCAxxG_C_C family protein [Candidatus Minthocola equi]